MEVVYQLHPWIITVTWFFLIYHISFKINSQILIKKLLKAKRLFDFLVIYFLKHSLFKIFMMFCVPDFTGHSSVSFASFISSLEIWPWMLFFFLVTFPLLLILGLYIIYRLRILQLCSFQMPPHIHF